VLVPSEAVALSGGADEEASTSTEVAETEDVKVLTSTEVEGKDGGVVM
jgi:hypothetical protein